MIKKLKSRIFWILMLAFSIIVIGVISLFGILNYNNTIKSSTEMISRMANVFEDRLEGMYHVTVENSNIVSYANTNLNDEIKQYAVKLSTSNKETGIIGNYIFKIRNMPNNRKEITFLENEMAITRAKNIIILSIFISILCLLIIYVTAKKLSIAIVKPVEETFEKQKQFISDASHELKTPLAVIEANSEVLENEIGKNKWMTYIQNEIDSMNKLINELLLLAKTENINDIKERTKIDVSNEIEIVSSMFESMAYENNIDIETNIQKGVILNANKEDLEHIASVLVDNAIKHTTPKGKIIIELKKEKNEIVLNVKNMGDPIPENERTRIFERFYRIDKSRNRKEKRYGLGLAIAKSMVDKYKGNIYVDYKDGFTIFKVEIPLQ